MIFKSIVLKKTKAMTKNNPDRMAVLMPLGDIHWGAKTCCYKTFKDTVKRGLDMGAYFIGMGDYLDFASESQRAIMGQLRDSTKMQLDKQIKEIADEFVESIKKTKGKWIGLLKGNHSWEFSDLTNVEQYICKKLNCDYLGTSTYLRIIPEQAIKHRPEADLIVYAHHGKGNAQTIGGHLGKPEKVLEWTDADLVLMGHDHAQIAGKIHSIHITPDGIYADREKTVARTGSFLKAYETIEPLNLNEPAYKSEGSYVEKAAMMPAALGAICFEICIKRVDGSSYYRPMVRHII